MATESSPLRVPAVLLTMVLVGYLLRVGAFLLQPLIIAFLLCMICRPLVSALEKKKIPAGVTVFGLMLVLIAILAWGGGLLLDHAKAYADSLKESTAQVADVPNAAVTTSDATPSPDAVPATFDDLRALLTEHLDGASIRELDFKTLWEQVKSLLPKIGGVLLVALTAVQTAVSQVFLVLFFMIFIFAEQGVSRKKMLLAAGSQCDEVDEITTRIASDVQLYLSVKTGISLLTAVLCWIGLWLLGVPFAAAFAALTFLLNFIPNVGSILAGLFPALVAMGVNGGMNAALVMVLYGVVNIFLGSVVEPKVLGKQLNLSPLVILMALMFWGALWGIVGMFLAVPLTRTAQLVCANLPSLRWLAILMANDVDESKISAA